MRLNDLPRFLLFCDSAWRRDGAGKWRFRLESLENGQAFEATGDELAANRDRLDLWAAVRGLESIDQPSHVTLLTGSHYIGRGLRFGLPTWRERDWCWESYGRWTPVRDADLWRRIDTALHYHQMDCRVWSFAASGTTADVASDVGATIRNAKRERTGLGRRPPNARWKSAMDRCREMLSVVLGRTSRQRQPHMAAGAS